MSLLRKISTTLKKAGYRKTYDCFNNKIYLKWADERYGLGFIFNTLPKIKFPEVGFGILDKKQALLEIEIEEMQEFGVYHLSAAKSLYQEGFMLQEHSQPMIDQALSILEKQISDFEERQHELIDGYRSYSYKLQPFPEFYEVVPNLKDSGEIYHGLLFRLAEKDTLTSDDFIEGIKLAEEMKVYNKDLQFKLNLIEAYLKK